MKPKIPVRFRERVSRELAFPADAASLGSALADVPPFAALTVGFYKYPQALALLENRRSREPGGAGLVLVKATAIRLGEGLPTMASGGVGEDLFDGETWELTVYAVPKLLREGARATLEREGYARLRDWLARPAAPARGAGRRSFEIRFLHRDGRLRYQEQQ